MKKETIMLSNLNCPSCAADLQKALATLEGVQRSGSRLRIRYAGAGVRRRGRQAGRHRAHGGPLRRGRGGPHVTERLDETGPDGPSLSYRGCRL